MKRFHIRARWSTHIPEEAQQALNAPWPAGLVERSISYGVWVKPPGETVPGYHADEQVMVDRRQYKTREAAVAAMAERIKNRTLQLPPQAVLDIVEQE